VSGGTVAVINQCLIKLKYTVLEVQMKTMPCFITLPWEAEFL